jgi:hypothetical protein
LKKQSQFADRQINVRSYKKKTYGKITACGAPKNKANLSLREQSQTTPKGVDQRPVDYGGKKYIFLDFSLNCHSQGVKLGN